MSVVESPCLHLPEPYLHMVQDVLRDHLPDAEVWAYGSRVNGDYHDTSDLDLVVRQPDDLRRRQASLGDVIEAFSESHLPILVQLVDWAAIPATFHAEIAAKYVVLQQPAGLVSPSGITRPNGAFCPSPITPRNKRFP
ncbi:MAG: nucleotidyltransferase domain-containing protein [Sulfuricellaceae bacterium]|nr:nucleotidyltransferase domain-containing protein [Sulfuricellaceae bacterium]